ncbi:MAG: glycerate kinase [Bacillota bacterium]|nr:glycerate kinase [Bacillota bacterium]
MKIVVAPDSFKGSLSAKQVADALEKGIKKVDAAIEVVKVPMADGGEGTVQSLVDAASGKLIPLKVMDPLMREIDSFYGILGDGSTAVIEMAAASGLPLLKAEERNPWKTTTYGTGQLIKHALDMGCRNIILGIGGSATNDGGCGMAAALGVKFLDKAGNEISLGGGSLSLIHYIDISELDKRIKECSIAAACDVDNPLVGPKGASQVFGPQKGADKDMVLALDKNLIHYGKVVKESLGVSILDYPGSGAAGGLGGGLLAFLGADLKRGVDIVIEAVKLEEKIIGADLVITGEGMIDYQTLHGKTPYGVALAASKQGIPVIAVAGGIGENIESLYDHGFTSIFSIVDKPMKLDDTIKCSERLLESTAERIIRAIKISF